MAELHQLPDRWFVLKDYTEAGKRRLVDTLNLIAFLLDHTKVEDLDIQGGLRIRDASLGAEGSISLCGDIVIRLKERA